MASHSWWIRLFRALPLVFTALLITGTGNSQNHFNWYKHVTKKCSLSIHHRPGISWTTLQLRWSHGQSGWLCFFIPAQIFLNWIQVFVTWNYFEIGVFHRVILRFVLSIKARSAKEDITRKSCLLSALPKLSRPGNLVFFLMSKQCFVRMTENSTNDGCNVIFLSKKNQ